MLERASVTQADTVKEKTVAHIDEFAKVSLC
jgi:hypothetical protein